MELNRPSVFARVVDILVKLLLPVVIVALMMGIAKVFLNLWGVWRNQSLVSGFDTLVTDILSMFVVIELLKSIVEYFEIHRIKLTTIVDATMVFLLREVMIGLFTHRMGAAEIGAVSGLLLVTGAIRTAAVVFSPERRTHAAHDGT
jgi:uncharacterized membrane protein (DUF373 family)